jgi:hypothetical protein
MTAEAKREGEPLPPNKRTPGRAFALETLRGSDRGVPTDILDHTDLVDRCAPRLGVAALWMTWAQRIWLNAPNVSGQEQKPHMPYAGPKQSSVR